MAVLEFNNPTRVIVGVNVVNRLPEIIEEFGERVLIVTSSEMVEQGIVEKVQGLADTRAYGVLVFDKVDSISGSETVDEGVLLARESKANVIIGLGGANTLNIAKAIAFIAGNEGGYLADYFAGRIGKRRKITYIEIPSTHGICYGLLDSFFITDNEDGTRREYRNKYNYADVLISDPRLTLSLPNKFIVAIGIEVLAQAYDAYISKSANMVTEAFASLAMEQVATNLKQSIIETDNVQLRNSLCNAGVFSSLALNSSRPGTTFALAQALGNRMGVYRGIGFSIILPHVMEFNLTASPTKYLKIAKSLGENVSDISVVEAAIKAVEGVRKILFDLNVPQRLKNFDVDEDRFDEIVRDARTFDFLNMLPRPVTYDDLLNILSSAY